MLAEKGYDPNLGARPLKRVIQKQVLDPLAIQIVAGKILEGERVFVEEEGEKIIFKTPKDLVKKGKEKVAV